jgi:hypothetical protein
MTTNGSPERFQLKLATLLLVVTVACLLFGFLEWTLPEDIPIGFRLIIYVSYTAMVLWVAWTIVRERRRWPRPSPTDYVTVKVDTKWLRRLKSPFIFGPVAALTGVSLTFAPLFLLTCGQVREWTIYHWVAVSVSFLMIYLVPGFYMSLASEVMAELVKIEGPPSDVAKLVQEEAELTE